VRGGRKRKTLRRTITSRGGLEDDMRRGGEKKRRRGGEEPRSTGGK